MNGNNITASPLITTHDVVFATLYSSIVFFGVTANGIIITIVRKTRTMHTTTNYLLMNLAIADFLTLLLRLCTTQVSIGLRDTGWHLLQVYCRKCNRLCLFRCLCVNSVCHCNGALPWYCQTFQQTLGSDEKECKLYYSCYLGRSCFFKLSRYAMDEAQ